MTGAYLVMKKKLYVAIGSDCDPDRPGYGGPLYSEKTLTWRGNEEGISFFSAFREKFSERNGYFPKITWNVRADRQIEMVHGSAGYCLQKHDRLWNSLEKEGDEIAWHPHLWDWDDNAGKWYQKVNDYRFKERCFSTGIEAFRHVLGLTPHTVHAGWCYQDNETLAILSREGVRVDYSANPGQDTMGQQDMDRSLWDRTPSNPYYPSAKDYQTQSENKGENLTILEVPSTTGEHRGMNLLKVISDQLKHGVNLKAIKHSPRQVPFIALKPALFKLIMRDVLKRERQPVNYFLSYFHSDELLPEQYKRGLKKNMYKLEHIFKNLILLKREAEKSDMELSFVTVRELLELIEKGQSETASAYP